MREKNINSDFGINFDEFTVPIVSESEISAACDKIVEHLPLKRTGFKMNLHRYGLFAACAVLMIIIITAVPSLFHNKTLINPNEALEKIDNEHEAQDSGEDKSTQYTFEAGGQDSAESDTQTAEMKEGAPKTKNEKAQPPSVSKSQGQAPPKAKAAEKPIGNDNSEPETDIKVNTEATESRTETNSGSLDNAVSEFVPPTDTPDTENTNKQAEDVLNSDIHPEPEQKEDSTMVSEDEIINPPESPASATASGKGGQAQGSSPEVMSSLSADRITTVIETELIAGEYIPTVLLSTGFLNFKQVEESVKTRSLVKVYARTEAWTEEKLISKFGIDPRPKWIPEDIKSELLSDEEKISVSIAGHGESEIFKVSFSYSDNLDSAVKKLTLEAIKTNEENPTPTESFNSNISGFNIYTEYVRVSDGLGKYSAKFSFQGLEFFINSEGLTQEEFIKVLLSVFEV